MKKFILLSLVCLTSLTISAQNFGLISGVSVANLSSTESNSTIDDDPRIGVFLGVVSEFGDENIKLSTELIFNQKGNDSQINFNSIDLGLKGNFYFNDEICLNIGPSIGYLLSGLADSGVSGLEKIDNWDDFNNRLDFSACFGISYKINDLLTAGYSYKTGMSSILSDTDLKTNSSNISIAYIFEY